MAGKPGDLLGSIGYGVLTRQVITKLAEQEGVAEPTPKLLPPSNSRTGQPGRCPVGIAVKGPDNLLVRISKCCNPVPAVFIDCGVSFEAEVYRCTGWTSKCRCFAEEPERRIEVQWNTDNHSSYPAELAIEAALDRTNLLASIMNAIAETNS